MFTNQPTEWWEELTDKFGEPIRIGDYVVVARGRLLGDGEVLKFTDRSMQVIGGDGSKFYVHRHGADYKQDGWTTGRYGYRRPKMVKREKPQYENVAVVERPRGR